MNSFRLREGLHANFHVHAPIFGLKNAFWWFWPDLAMLPKTDKAKTAKKGHFWVIRDLAGTYLANHSQQLPKMALSQMRTVRSQPLKMMLFIRDTGDNDGIEDRKSRHF